MSTYDRPTLDDIRKCSYCQDIVTERNRTPISCTKLSGSTHPVFINLNACILCAEYEKSIPGKK